MKLTAKRSPGGRIAAALALLAGLSAFHHDAVAQTEDESGLKAEVIVSNYRPAPITMRVDYMFQSYGWNLVDQTIKTDSDLTYRFPSNLPGCEYLKDWGIDRGKLTISDAGGEICAAEFSLCTRRVETVFVRPNGCTSQVRN
ncbi:MAG: hypothetical protein KDE14_02975 [Rhodobacteraceae bacterium]|nr:hypothetical protein [Paracoccaceae bacterium]